MKKTTPKEILDLENYTGESVSDYAEFGLKFKDKFAEWVKEKEPDIYRHVAENYQHDETEDALLFDLYTHLGEKYGFPQGPGPWKYHEYLAEFFNETEEMNAAFNDLLEWTYKDDED